MLTPPYMWGTLCQGLHNFIVCHNLEEYGVEGAISGARCSDNTDKAAVLRTCDR